MWAVSYSLQLAASMIQIMPENCLSAGGALWNAEVINENPEGKQYKDLTAEWYDVVVLFVLSIGNSRCCFVWILFTTDFLLQCYFLSGCLLACTLDTRLLSTILQNETSSFTFQDDSVIKKGLSPSISVDLLKFGMLVSVPTNTEKWFYSW